MADELAELLDMAIYKEIASEAMYVGGQKNTDDPGAIAIMRELAGEERQHTAWLKELKDSNISYLEWKQEQVTDLMISEYLVGGETLEKAGLQDTLLFAIMREQQSVDFYAGMAGLFREREAIELCHKLENSERSHKLKLERMYDDLFYGLDEAKKWQ